MGGSIFSFFPGLSPVCAPQRLFSRSGIGAGFARPALLFPVKVSAPIFFYASAFVAVYGISLRHLYETCFAERLDVTVPSWIVNKGAYSLFLCVREIWPGFFPPLARQ